MAFITLFSFQAFGDAAINKEISELRVRCVTPGCSWSGIMKDFEVHSKRVYSDEYGVGTERQWNQGISRHKLMPLIRISVSIGIYTNVFV